MNVDMYFRLQRLADHVGICTQWPPMSVNFVVKGFLENTSRDSRVCESHCKAAIHSIHVLLLFTHAYIVHSL